MVDPFVALPNGYNSIRITWTNPSGAWDRIRLIRGKGGFAVNESDGLVLLDETQAVSEWVDSGLLGKTWFYYTLWIHNSDGWFRAGIDSALSVGNDGMADILWDRIPGFFRYTNVGLNPFISTYEPTAELVDPNSDFQVNHDLLSFVRLLGWGLDYLHNYHDTVTWALDPSKTHLYNVDLLAQTLGTQYEFEVPGSVMRQRVENAGSLAQSRGTLEGLRELINVTVGYDVDLSVSANMFLNEDQGTFTNPQFPVWDTGVNYVVGAIVEFQGFIYEALVGNLNTPPPNDGGSDSTWQNITNQATTLLNPVDDNGDPIMNVVSTWAALRDADETLRNTPTLALVYGVSSPVDTGVASNALSVNPTTDYTGAITATRDTSGIRVVNEAIPLPRVLDWDPDAFYAEGEYVVYNNLTWWSLHENHNRQPDKFTEYWTQVGIDERTPVQFSFWCHAGYSDPGTMTMPGIRYYDGRGNPIGDWWWDPTMYTGDPFVDTFNRKSQGTPLNTQFGDFGISPTWTTSSVWRYEQDNDGYRVAAPVAGTGNALVSYTTQVANANDSQCVSATFRNAPLPGHQQLLVVNYTDANNYIAVSRTELYKMVAGTKTSLLSLNPNVQTGDHVMVEFFTMAPSIRVYVNGVLQGASSGVTALSANASMKSGMMVI